MAKLVDNLNYSKFDFIDSDDEDFVDQMILKQSLSDKTSKRDLRNAAAHAMAKEGAKVTDGALNENITQARTKMEEQLSDLQKQMKDFEVQQNKLDNINSADEAMKFFEESGMTEEQVMGMLQKVGQAPEGQDAVENSVSSVNKFSKGMEELLQEPVLRKGKDNEKVPKMTSKTNNTAPTVAKGFLGGANNTTKKTKKKIVIEEDSDDTDSDDMDFDIDSSIPKLTTPQVGSIEIEGGTRFSIEVPGITSISELNVQTSQSTLLVEEIGDRDGRFFWKKTFDQKMDDSRTKAKWKKKLSVLQIDVFR
jgi:hypothetical protein